MATLATPIRLIVSGLESAANDEEPSMRHDGVLSLQRPVPPLVLAVIGLWVVG